MLDALIIPTEEPLSSLELKRALLIFGRVSVIDPSDRELIQRSTFSNAISPLPMLSGIDMGPVLPIGKVRDHDDRFGKVLEEAKDAISEGLVVLESAPEPGPAMFLGNLPTPKSWPDPRWIVQNFVQFGARKEYLLAACPCTRPLSALAQEDLEELAPDGVALTTRFQENGQPPLAEFSVETSSTALQLALNRLAAARLGTTLKCLGIAQVCDKQPFSIDPSIAELIALFQAESQKTVDYVDQHSARSDAHLLNRVARLVLHDECSRKALEKMSFRDVIRLRTRAWGQEGEARQAFLRKARQVALESASDEQFDSAVNEVFDSYRSKRAELDTELKGLVTKGAVALVSGATVHGVTHALSIVPGWDAVIGLATAAWALNKEFVPELVRHIDAVQKRDADSTYSLIRPFRDIV